MIKFRYIAAAAFLCGAATAQAQWSLDSCINYANANSIAVKQRIVQARNAEQGVVEAKDAFLPTAQAGAQQSFDFGRGLTSQNTYANRNTSQFGWNVGVSVPLFQGLSAKRQLDVSRTNLQKALEEVEAAKDDLTLNVLAQYLQVLYANEMAQMAHERVALSQAELQRRRVMVAAGKVAELDLLEAESQVASDSLSALNADNDRALAHLSLAELIQLPYTPQFSILPLDGEGGILPSANDVYNNALAINHGVRAAQYDVKAAEQNVSLARSGYLPRLSMSAGLGSGWYGVSGMDNAGFGQQMRTNFSRNIGFTLSIPLFDAFATRNRERRARAATVSAELTLDNTRTQLYNAIVRAHSMAQAANGRVAQGTLTCRAAEAAFQGVATKYNLGRANATEYDRARRSWFEARTSLIQARYESILRARILAFYQTGR